VSLSRLPPAAIEQVARRIRITDHRTGASTAWAPNESQRLFWVACYEHPWVFAAKPRQIGITTAGQLDDLLWCAVNDAAGNRVRAGLFVDTDDKIVERAALARSIVDQLPQVFHGCTVNSERVQFPGGSVLEFHTGSGQNAGRSGGFQRLHLTELPFYLNDTTLGALIPSLSLDVGVIIETTIDMEGPNAPATKRLWRDPTNAYHRVFFSVESHREYRLPADRITDQQWSWMSSADMGFTDRESAAWWLAHCVPNMCSGDVNKALREYPQMVEHMFSTASGRFIPISPKVLEPVAYLPCAGTNVASWVPLSSSSGQVVIAVDTGKGVERDRSAVVVLDKRDLRICAAFSSASLDAFEFGDVVAALVRHYTAPKPPPMMGVLASPMPAQPQLIVEENGIGEAMVLRLRQIGLAVAARWTDEGSKATGLTIARQAIVAGQVYGPSDLADECDDLHQHPDTGNFKGRKDLIMAVGFALLAIRLSPYQPPVAPRQREGHIDGLAIVRAHIRPRHGGW